MSMHFVTGKPGGGKSMFAVKQLVDELRLSNRKVVTNLPLKPGNLAAFLQEKYGDTFDLCNRLRMLEENEVCQFWRIRGQGRNLDGVRTIRHSNGEVQTVVDYAPAAEWGGVFYCIDEAHLYFDARNWQKTGNDCTYYLSQHRKLSDDILVVSQFCEQVEKRFRKLAQDFTTLRNMTKEKVGIFRSFPVFARTTYLSEPTSPNVKATESGFFRLDCTGLGSCYDTAAGVGIVGRDADAKHAKKGVPISFLFVGVGVVLAGLAATPFALNAAVKGRIAPAIAAKGDKLKPSLVVKTNEENRVLQSVVGGTVQPRLLMEAEIKKTNEVYLTGSLQTANGYKKALLSDGTSYGPENGLTYLDGNQASINGKTYKMK